jgi:hypothetical protein
MTTVAKKKLYEVLVGHDSTDQWDVVVSYAEEKLNDLLRERWDQSRTFIDMPLDVVYEFIPSLKVTLHFKIHLGSPSLQFASGTGKAHLTMPLTGSYEVSGVPENHEEILHIPDGAYALEVRVPLAGVSGNEEKSAVGY